MESKQVKEGRKESYYGSGTATGTSTPGTTKKSMDFLDFANNQEIIRQLQDQSSEVIVMSIKVKKWNKVGLWAQARSFCVTNYNIYNFNNNKLRRIIPIRSLEGITKNLTNNSKEFVVHVTNEPDYRLSCDHRQ